jgi:hypothetical protein
LACWGYNSLPRTLMTARVSRLHKTYHSLHLGCYCTGIIEQFKILLRMRLRTTAQSACDTLRAIAVFCALSNRRVHFDIRLLSGGA